MPTYEYRCNACRREFEYQQRMSDDDLVTCEACNEPKLEKLISRTAFQLKGGGWYKDLYASTKPEASKESPAASTTPSTDKAADKPAAKADSGSSSSSSDSSSSGTAASTPAAAAPSTPKPSSTP